MNKIVKKGTWNKWLVTHQVIKQVQINSLISDDNDDVHIYYIYIYIYIYIYKSFIHSINKHCPWKKWKFFLSIILLILLVAITLSLANCELNYTPFCIIRFNLPQFKEAVELSTLTHWFDWSLNFTSNEILCKPKGHHNVKL